MAPPQRRLLLPLLSLCWSLLPLTTAADWSPFLALRPRHLVAFYPLDSDYQDYAPLGAAGYQQHGVARRLAASGISQESGARLEPGSGLDLPLNIHRRAFPRLTLGAWVQVDPATATSNGCLLSQDGSNIGRALCVNSGNWVAGQHNASDGGAVAAGKWSFVAAAFDGDSASVFVDGTWTARASPARSIASHLVVVGAAASQSLGGISGFIKSLFVFDEALSAAELRYLMAAEMRAPLPVAVGSWGYAFQPPSPEHQAYVAIPTAKLAKEEAASVLMWIALNLSSDPHAGVCLCQLAAPEDLGAISVWASYDATYGAHFARVLSVRNANADTSEFLFPTARLHMSAHWQRLAITWDRDGLRIFIDDQLAVRVDVKIWCLDAQALLDCGPKLSGAEEGLLGYWTFDSAEQTLLAPTSAVTRNTILDAEIRVLSFNPTRPMGPLFLGPSGTSISDQIQVNNDAQAERIKLTAFAPPTCSSVRFSIVKPPDLGALFKASGDGAETQDSRIDDADTELNNPQTFEGSVTLAVYAEALPYEKSNMVNLAVVPAFTLWSLQPENRQVHLASEVNIQGAPSFDPQFAVCRINRQIEVLPLKVTADSISCRIPQIDPNEHEGTFELEISQNAVDFVSVGEFWLCPRPWIFRLSPARVFRSMTSQVLDIFGMNFLNLTSLSCSAGGIESRAAFISASRVQCVVEPLQYDELSSLIEVDVSVNGADFTEQPAHFSLVKLPSISSLTPDNGPTAGGTMVGIAGEGFSDDSRYSIYSEEFVTGVVEYVNSSFLVWRTADVDLVGGVNIGLTIDGVLYPEMSSAQFTFTPLPLPVSIFPQLGPVEAETMLTISGSGFGNFLGLRYDLRVSLNGGVHFSKQATHVFVYDTPIFRNVTSISPVNSAVTSIQVIGAGFVVNGSTALNVTCIFGVSAPWEGGPNGLAELPDWIV
ncbi:hypothetical protein BBJ28_00003663 [Nothophytophthora sp. Chile5]|nr:hypothetical protein BBJ28_00003663 [Nothophytophthora sp. Chile5]